MNNARTLMNAETARARAFGLTLRQLARIERSDAFRAARALVTFFAR